VPPPLSDGASESIVLPGAGPGAGAGPEPKQGRADAALLTALKDGERQPGGGMQAVPPYVVSTNRTLVEIAASQPATLSALAESSGIAHAPKAGAATGRRCWPSGRWRRAIARNRGLSLASTPLGSPRDHHACGWAR